MTANIETAVLNYLLADSTLATLVAGRIYPVARPQGSSLPAIVVRRISGGPLYADEGEVGLVNARLQIDSYGENYTVSKDLAKAVDDRLSGVKDTVSSGVTMIFITLSDERDMREPGSEQFEYTFRVSQDYLTWSDM